MITSTGDTPGLTFDASDIKTAGPYTLTFRIQSNASGDGTIYWTTDAKTSLPKGGHQTFKVTHEGQWQDIVLNLAEPKILHALRLDPCAGKGVVRLDSLQLKDATGKTLKQWP